MHSEQLWLVSFADDDDRELTTEELARALAHHEVRLSTLVWREGMPQWKPLSAFKELIAARASKASRSAPPSPSNLPPPLDVDDDPITLRTQRPPPLQRKSLPASSETSPRHAADAEAKAVTSNSTEEELDGNDLLWLPAEAEPVSSDFLGLSRPDASLAPPPIDLPMTDPLDDRDGRTAALETLMASRVRVAVTVPQIAVTTRPVSKEITTRRERRSVLCSPWLIAAAVITGGAYFLFSEGQKPEPDVPSAANPGLTEPMASSPPPSVQAVTQPPPATASTQVAAPASATASVVSQAAPVASTPPQSAVSATPAPEPVKPAAEPRPVVVAPAATIAPSPTKHVSEEKVVAAEPTPKPTTPAELPPAEASKPANPATEPFDPNAAMVALDAVASQASACRQEGDPSGTAEVQVTFSTSGRATQAVVNGPPFAGTKTGSCIATALRSARIPAFVGERTTVQKRIVIH